MTVHTLHHNDQKIWWVLMTGHFYRDTNSCNIGLGEKMNQTEWSYVYAIKPLSTSYSQHSGQH